MSDVNWAAMRNAIGGIYVGPRDPRANTAFNGAWMAADMDTWQRLHDESDYTFTDGGESMLWCIVGDDPIALEQTAIDCFTGEEI